MHFLNKDLRFSDIEGVIVEHYGTTSQRDGLRTSHIVIKDRTDRDSHFFGDLKNPEVTVEQGNYLVRSVFDATGIDIPLTIVETGLLKNIIEARKSNPRK